MRMLILALFIVSTPIVAEDVYVVIHGSVEVKYFLTEADARINRYQIRTFKYVSPVIKMKKERYADKYAEASFKEAVAKKQGGYHKLGNPVAKTFNDRKVAYAYFKEECKTGMKLSFTKGRIEKKWREEN